jgi:succinate dehydrogenase flavin-adding protein (antitoxin of CptAB toxin-antitoxin module)
MRELDALLEAFLDRDFAALDRGEIALLEQILDLPDPELHGYLVRSIEPEDRAVAALIARIRHSLHPQTGAVR